MNYAQKGFVPILLLGGFFVVLGIVSGIILLPRLLPESVKTPYMSSLKNTPISPSIINSLPQTTIVPKNVQNPQEIVREFFQAVQNKNKTKAKSFLSLRWTPLSIH